MNASPARVERASLMLVIGEPDHRRAARLPFAPLAEFTATRGPICSHGETFRRAYTRARTRGWVTIQTGERMAARLGVHPFVIFGRAYFDAATRDLDIELIPTESRTGGPLCAS